MGWFKKINKKPDLADLKVKGDINGIIKILYSKAENDVDDATEAIVKMGEKAIDPLIEKLGDTTTNVKGVYAWGKEIGVSWPTSIPLAQFGEKAIEKLIQTLEVRKETGNFEKDVYDRNRRVGAAITLGFIRNTKAIQPLIKSLESDPDPTGAAIALGMIGDPQAVEPLIKKLDNKELAEHTTRVIIQALGIIGDKRANGSLVKIISAPHWGNYADEIEKILIAIEALSDIRDEMAVEPLIESLSDENSIIRWRAAKALGKMKDTRAVESLLRALSDKKKLYIAGDVEYICVAAAESLGKIGDSAAVEALINVLSDKRKELRIQAAQSLGEIGDVKATEALKQGLKDKELPVQKAFQEALGKLNEVST